MAVVVFAAGLAMLIASGHVLVRTATRIGAGFHLPPNIIGLTIVAGGTSAPELAVVFQSLRNDDPALAVGSIIGSNIANVLLVLGLAAIIGRITVTSRVVRIDIPFMILASLALLVMTLDGLLTRADGLILVVALIGFVWWTVRASRSQTAPQPGKTDTHRHEQLPSSSELAPSFRDLAARLPPLILSVVGLAVASRFVVSGAEQIAVDLSLPELVVGLTVVALGTSAPEIATTLIAAFNGQRDLAVGNAVGSNIFNVLLVLGLSSTLASAGLPFSNDAVRIDLPIMAAAAIACLPLVFWDHAVERWEGGLFVALYVAYVVFLGLDGSGHWAGDPFAFAMLAFVIPLTALTVAVILVRRRRGAGRPQPRGAIPQHPDQLSERTFTS